MNISRSFSAASLIWSATRVCFVGSPCALVTSVLVLGARFPVGRFIVERVAIFMHYILVVALVDFTGLHHVTTCGVAVLALLNLVGLVFVFALSQLTACFLNH